MSSVRLFHPIVPGPLAQQASPGASPSSSDGGWYLAEVMQSDMLAFLREQGLNNVAFIRYHGANLLGVNDVRVYLDPSCTNLADTTRVFSLTPRSKSESFWIRPVDRPGDELALPIHPKDADRRKLVSLPEGAARWAGLDAENSAALIVRDSGSSQIGNERIGTGATQSAHLIPHRRGNAMYLVIAQSRAPGESQFLRGHIDGVRNLVTLSPGLHHAWDNHKLFLMPFPNVGFNSHGQPLPWVGSATEQDPATAWQQPGLEYHIPATRSVPLLRCFSYTGGPVTQQGTSADANAPPVSRLRGPFPTYANLWPAEWAWSYRFTAQIAALCKTPELTSQLQSAWLQCDDDACGSVVTTTSFEGGDSSAGGDAGGPSGAGAGPSRKRPRQDDDDNDATPKSSRKGRTNAGSGIPFSLAPSSAAINARCRAWAAEVAASTSSMEEGKAAGEGESVGCGVASDATDEDVAALDEVWVTVEQALPEAHTEENRLTPSIPGKPQVTSDSIQRSPLTAKVQN